jgi:hypothetical protein
MTRWYGFGGATLAAIVLGCAATSFVSSWKAPDAAPLQLRGAKVVAVVMDTSEASRRVAEDRMARELTERGAVGIPMYKILPDTSPESEAAARDALEGQNIAGLVVMRPIGTDQEIVVTPGMYTGPRYGAYWGGYYGFGWAEPWGMEPTSGAEVRINQVVWVETLIYSLRQNKLVWAGQSRTTNPATVDELVTELADETAAELEKMGLIRSS